MPRNETRPVLFSNHAAKRLRERGIAEAEARQIVLAGVWHPDGWGDRGEPKWKAFGAIRGRPIQVVFVETTDHHLAVLYVVTVHH